MIDFSYHNTRKVRIEMKNKSKKNEVHKSTIRLGINYYHEFVTDIDLQGKPHRVFYNPIVKEFFVNEILSYDYNGKGNMLLKNPAFKIEDKEKLIEIIENQIPENEQLNCINAVKNYFKTKLLKTPKTKPENNRKGRTKSIDLIITTFWAMKNRKPGETYSDINGRAYRRFKPVNISEESFKRSIERERKTILRAFTGWKIDQLEKKKKEEVTFENFKKDYLRRHKTIVKQRVTEKV